MPSKPPKPPAPHRATVRSLAASAHLPVDDVVCRLREAGLTVRHATEKLEGAELRKARQALGMRGRGERPPPARRLTRQQLIMQCLRPLREKGKVGRMHTTPVEHVWGRGVPDHQKKEAQEFVKQFLQNTVLDQKESQGRTHVWLTRKGRARLEAAERGDGETV